MTLEGGAVYVDSGGKGPPLEIRAGRGVARDLGTQFEVRMDAGVTRVRVREGEVAWDQAGRSEKASAGSEIDIDERGEVRRAAISPHGPEWTWVQQVAPPFELEGRTVGEFLDWVSRETGFRVRLEGADAARLAKATVLHGSSSGMTPEEALSAVLPTCGLVHRVENGQIVVSPEAARRGR
jgi:ferric-dicitrate binding protein FerR (iron transport regulator)